MAEVGGDRAPERSPPPSFVDDVLVEARGDANVVGVLLKGSQSMGAADEESDWDIVLVLLEGEPSQRKDGSLELITTTLERVKGVSSWELPALAHSRVLLDKTGELAVAVEAAGQLTREELAELYDNYLNDFYRSLKAWRRGRELGARILSARSLWWLGGLLIGFEGKRAPYTEYFAGRLGELEPLIVEVARTADPRKQQELQAAVEQIATAHGFRDLYDAWNGDIDRVMDFRFE